MDPIGDSVVQGPRPCRAARALLLLTLGTLHAVATGEAGQATRSSGNPAFGENNPGARGAWNPLASVRGAAARTLQESEAAPSPTLSPTPVPFPSPTPAVPPPQPYPEAAPAPPPAPPPPPPPPPLPPPRPPPAPPPVPAPPLAPSPVPTQRDAALPPPPLTEAQKQELKEKKADRIRKTAVFGASLARTYRTGQEAFTAIDASRDGVIDAAELATAAGQFQYQGPSADLFQDVDTTRDGKITLSELTQFAKDYFPPTAGLMGNPQKEISWSPGYDGKYPENRALPNTGAHRRRTISSLGATNGHLGIGPASQVLWMRLGRTTGLVPVAWVGEYNDLGEGKCRTMEAHTPVYADLLNTPEGVCRGKCDTSLSCYGFSWSRNDQTCRLWKESGLRGGGPMWGGSKCLVKVFDLVRDNVVPSEAYERMGAGKCLAGAGRDYPESVFHQNVDEHYCTSRCSSSPECFGYTWSAQLKHCYLWKLTDLRAPPDGTVGTAAEACMVKVYKISSTTGESSSQPPNAAPLLGAYDVGGSNVHAMKFPLGRTVSSVPTAWDGQWKVQEPNPGRCMTSSAREPAHRIHKNLDAGACQTACGGDPSCYGYSWTNTGECLVWMQPDLWGGGTKDGGFSCVIKQFAVLTSPVESTGQFTIAGPGLCQTGWGTNPASAYLGKVQRAQCRTACEGDSTCTGFSWQPSGECAIHYEAGLRSSRTTYSGNIACYVKDYHQALGASSDGTFASVTESPQPAVASSSSNNNGGSYYNSGGPSSMQQRQQSGTPGVGAFVGAAMGAASGNTNNGNSAWPSSRNNNNNGGGNNNANNNNNNGNGNGYNNGYSNNGGNGYDNGNNYNDNNQQVQQGTHHNVIMSALSGVGGALLSNHIFGGGSNNGNQDNRGNSNDGGRASSGGRSNRASVEEGGESQNPNAPFVFWTPNDPGSATCKTDLPNRDFPAVDAKATNAAWPSGHQPQNDECWHKDQQGLLKACWYTKILYSTERGWPGKCEGMMAANTGGLKCQESCVRNPQCPVWQTRWERGGIKVCLQGRGRDCAGMRAGAHVNVDASERIQHGSVRILKNLKGIEIRNLRQDFDAKYYARRSDATMACKSECYSDIHCQYWVYSTTDGCFLEDPPMHAVPYPLTQNDVNHNSAFARSVIAGEYILHRCPENDGTFTSEEEGAKFTLLPWEWNWFAFHWPWDEGGWPWWGWLMFFFLSCCVCGFCLICFGACGLYKLGKERAKGELRVHELDDVVDSSSSSDSDVEGRKGRHSPSKSQKQALLQDQHFTTLAHGHGQQAMQVVHSTQGSHMGTGSLQGIRS